MNNTTEDYLKTIRILQNENGKVRSIDIAKALSVSKPTVSCTVKRLAAEGYIRISNDYLIELTEQGLAVADEVLERNRIIRELLISLGVERSVAEADACRMEHAISPQSLSALKSLATKSGRNE